MMRALASWAKKWAAYDEALRLVIPGVYIVGGTQHPFQELIEAILEDSDTEKMRAEGSFGESANGTLKPVLEPELQITLTNDGSKHRYIYDGPIGDVRDSSAESSLSITPSLITEIAIQLREEGYLDNNGNIPFGRLRSTLRRSFELAEGVMG